ncbi:hypothetical protein GCM10027038_37710 [Arthrobacter bambusae]
MGISQEQTMIQKIKLFTVGASLSFTSLAPLPVTHLVVPGQLRGRMASAGPKTGPGVGRFGKILSPEDW